MKICLSITLAFLLAACSNAGGNNAAQPENKVAGVGNNNANAAELSEKNKRIAFRNEATRATETAQMLEKQGRQMESYRLAADAETARECKAVEANFQREVKDLETKIKSLPDPFDASLTPIMQDLKACVSCSKQAAMPACVKARASINDAIKEMFAQ